MAAKCIAASSQYLLKSSLPVISGLYPYTMGAWVNTDAATASNQCLLSFAVAGSANNFTHLNLSSTIIPRFSAFGTGSQSFTTTTALTAGTWNFLLLRGINSTNRRLSALHFNGLIEHAQGISAVTFGTTPNSAGIGSLVQATPDSFLNGLVGEVWYTNTDIQADGAQLQDATLRQLAFGGPFSIPHVRTNLLEYRSLRKHPTSDGDDPNEIFSISQQTWTNVNGVIISAHPPLPYWYANPKDRSFPFLI